MPSTERLQKSSTANIRNSSLGQLCTNVGRSLFYYSQTYQSGEKDAKMTGPELQKQALKELT